MIHASQIPDEVWTELALRLESCGAVVSDQVARLAACAVINAWPGVATGAPWIIGVKNVPSIILPLPQEPRDE